MQCNMFKNLYIFTLHKSDIFQHICIGVKVFRKLLSSKSCIYGAFKVPGSIPGSGTGFMFDIFCFVVVVFLLFLNPKTHYLSHNFAMLIYIVYFTYCKICYRLKGYTDTDLASLTFKTHLQNFLWALSKTSELMFPHTSQP